MRRLDLIIQTEGLETFLEKILKGDCRYCEYCDADGECKSTKSCSEAVMESLTQEMIIDFDEIVAQLQCAKEGCSKCEFQGKNNCTTLYLWSNFGKVL